MRRKIKWDGDKRVGTVAAALSSTAGGSSAKGDNEKWAGIIKGGLND